MNSLMRWWEIARREAEAALRRPASWVLFGFLVLLGMSYSVVTAIASGDASVGGELPHVTSVYHQARFQSTTILIFGAWFLAMSAGLPVIRDNELGVIEVIRSTRLTEREYVWGKFGGALGAFLLFWLLFLCLLAGFNHLWGARGFAELIGPFSVWNYLFPTLLFGLPQILVLAGFPLLLGLWSRRPFLVFAFAMLSLLFAQGAAFAGEYGGEMGWVGMLLDLSGGGWVRGTYLAVDRGVEFYNTAPLLPGAAFVLSRLSIAAAGLLAVAFAARRYRLWMRRGGARVRRAQVRAAGVGAAQAAETAAGVAPPVAETDVSMPHPVAETSAPATQPATPRIPVRDLQMQQRPLGFRAAAAAIARSELRDLIRRPAMLVFVPVLLLVALSEGAPGTGPFGSAVLLTSGGVAAAQMDLLNMLICFLLLFYTVESLHKERSRRMHEIFRAAPVGTGAIVLGKILGNSVVAVFILGAAFVCDALIIVIGGNFDTAADFEILPFAATWGLVLVPTFLFWTALVALIYSLLRGRYTSYAVGIAVLIYSFGRVADGAATWATSWSALDIVTWSDMGAFSLHGTPLILNRLLYLSLVPLLFTLAVKFYPRRDRDAVQFLKGANRRTLLARGARVLPMAAPAIVLATVLNCGGGAGYQGPAATEWEKDYWRRNTATWTGFRMPSVSGVDLDLDIEPRDRSVGVRGAYTFFNHRDRPYEQLPITAGPWEPLEWTLGGAAHRPRNRSNLFIFELEEPLAPGDSVTIGFSYDVVYLHGMSRRPGGAGQFVLESGVVLNNYSLSFVPLPGYVPGIGVDEDNRAQPRDYPDDFHEGVTEPRFGWGGVPFQVRTRITTPGEYTANGVGQLVSDEVAAGRRTVVWETDHPVGSFNVVAGRYAVKEGNGTAIYYHPSHDYNIEEMSAALDSARHYYSEWFHPFPWSVLKLSEFPDYAGYAQSYETNIVFSEGIGFLTLSTPGTDVAFQVVAHEAAHQWWGNMLEPGEGPGGNILSEGMANYATKLLHAQVLGDRYRMRFSRDIEDLYSSGRWVNNERPLVGTIGRFAGDRTVTYNKGAWVMWMLQQEMGRENLLAGLRAFMTKYRPGPDHPVLYDLLDVVRDFAPDTAAFDAFAAQWFHDVVLPEYKLSDVTKTQEGDEWVVRGTVENVGTGRMRVAVGATAGFRWANEDESGDEGGGRSVVSDDYRDARTEVVVGAGEAAEFVIRAPFEPVRVVVDPDVMVLQLTRYAADFEFEG